MPGVGGLELAQMVEADNPDMPVLLATGYSDELLNSNGRNFTVVSKPYDATILRNAISSMLQGRCDKTVEAS
jgi:two-component system NtrC family sensor kinase